MAGYYESPPSSLPPEPARLGVRPLATALWCLGGLLAAAAVVAGAWLGVRAAESRYPDRKERSAFVPEMEITARGSHEAPLVLAVEQAELRDYIFRESSIAGTGLEGIGDGRVFEYRGSLDLRVVETDGDLIQVVIVAGPRAGETFWMEAPDRTAEGESADG